ncbi:unnamed protein product [Ectocarpus sp. 12 AP-2014]
MDIVTIYYHWEHFEFSICDAAEIDDPHGVVTQECFSMYALTRASDDGDASPKDPDYTGRLRRIQPSLVAKHLRARKGKLDSHVQLLHRLVWSLWNIHRLPGRVLELCRGHTE